jgi:hypothetical protein
MNNFQTAVQNSIKETGLKYPARLLSPGDTNTKTAKNEIKTFILYLMPYNQNSKGINLCPHASKGCAEACLVSAGRGAFSNVIKSRVNKTEIIQQSYKAKKGGYKVAFRLNGTSDVDFIYLLNKHANLDIKELQPHAIFYDYTKVLQRAIRYNGHPNYSVTFSRSETNNAKTQTALKLGINVSAVFNKLPQTYNGYKVVDGDASDIVMLKYNGVILGLKAKGYARKDTTGFTINI